MKAADPKKSGKKTTGSLVVHVEVLQNGATLLTKSRPLKGSNVLTLTSAGEGQFALPHYPLPDGKLEFLRTTNTGATLIVDHQWEGFCTSGGELVHITRGDRGRQTLPLGKGDYASITHEDLRIMVKLLPRRAAKKSTARRGTNPAYRRGLTHLFFPTVEEKRALLIAALACLVILGGAYAGLMKRTLHRPTRLAETESDFLLPFLAPDHLRTGPEALQENLDRRQNARSVMEFYQAFTALLTGSPSFDARYLMPTSIELYHQLHEATRQLVEDKIRQQQEVDHLQAMKSGVGVLPIAAVMGESMSGSMLRVIDKIDIMQQGFAADLKAKRQMQLEFPKDPEYNYEEYKNLGRPDDRAAAYLAQIKPWEKFTNEQMMYGEAEALAQRAGRKQRRMHANTRPSEYLSSATPQPIEIPAGAKFASFVSNVDFMLTDEKIYQLQGSEYGVARPNKANVVIREPLVGEIDPGLVEHFIAENKYQLQLCYELALRRNEDASGTMEWRWRIDSRGSISDIALISTSIKDPRMAQCIRQKIGTWRFPRPRRGSVEVSYPFEFAPAAKG